MASEGSPSASWSSGWSSASLDSYIGGKVRWSRTTNATATFTFKGTNIAVVGPVGSTRGKAKVYLDGKYVRTVDFHRGSFKARFAAFKASWKTSGAHTLRIVVIGSSSHPMVAIDEFVVTK